MLTVQDIAWQDLRELRGRERISGEVGQHVVPDFVPIECLTRGCYQPVHCPDCFKCNLCCRCGGEE